jgi:hypothetical protein
MHSGHPSADPRALASRRDHAGMDRADKSETRAGGPADGVRGYLGAKRRRDLMPSLGLAIT